METKKGSSYFPPNYITLKQLHDQRLKEKQEAEELRKLNEAAAAAEEERRRKLEEEERWRNQQKQEGEKLRRCREPLRYKKPYNHQKPKIVEPSPPENGEAKQPAGSGPDRDRPRSEVDGNPNAVREKGVGKGEIWNHEAMVKEGPGGIGDLRDPGKFGKNRTKSKRKNKNGGAHGKEEDRIQESKQENRLGTIALAPEPLPVKPARRKGESRRQVVRPKGEHWSDARVLGGAPDQAVDIVARLEKLTVGGGDEIRAETGEGKGGAHANEEARKFEGVLNSKQDSGLGTIAPKSSPVKPTGRNRGKQRKVIRSNGEHQSGARVPGSEPDKAVEIVGRLEELAVGGGDMVPAETVDGKVERGMRWTARAESGRNPRVKGTIESRAFQLNGEHRSGAKVPGSKPDQAVEIVGRLEEVAVGGGDEVRAETGEGKVERGMRWTARADSRRNPRVKGFEGSSRRGRSGTAPSGGMVWIKKSQ